MQKKLVYLLVVLLALLTCEVFFLDARFPALSMFLGFVGSFALMGFAKGLGKYWLYKKENYYEEK